MKKLFLQVLILVTSFSFVNGQSNTFPDRGNVGIGTLNPLAQLSVVRSDSVEVMIRAGLGRVYSYARLSLADNTFISYFRHTAGRDFPEANLLEVRNDNGQVSINSKDGIVLNGRPLAPWIFKGNINLTGLTWSNRLIISDYISSDTASHPFPNHFKFGVNGRSSFSDQVVIGTDCSPSDERVKLAVNGQILANQVRVRLEGGNCWADHVFSDDYALKPLEEIESFIKVNKHLPSIPSADEVSENGIEVADMFRLQMEKIEELTLYMIEMKKELNKLKRENEILKLQLR